MTEKGKTYRMPRQRVVLGALSLVFAGATGSSGWYSVFWRWYVASAPRKAYLENPERFTEVSYKNLNAGRICGIIGICIGALILLAVILAVIFAVYASVKPHLLNTINV